MRGDPAGSLDAWTTLAALAARTERLRLGTMVSPVTFRPASVLAKSVATVDHISNGRVELGIGAGWFEAEHETYGFPFLTSRERLDELDRQLAEITRQWTEAPDVWPKPAQQPHPPIIVGGRAKPRTVRAAVRYADEYNTVFPTVEEAAGRRRILDEAAREAGREPLRFSMMLGCVVGSRPGRGRRPARSLSGADLAGAAADLRDRSRKSSSGCASTRRSASSARCCSTSSTRTSTWSPSWATSRPVYARQVRLFVVRHAEAAPGEPDELRPLTEAGRAAARALAARLAREDVELVLASPLLRARETAGEIARTARAPLEVDERLAPGATPDGVRAAVGGRGETVVAVGHQPDCGEIVLALTGRVERFKPAAFVEVEL